MGTGGGGNPAKGTVLSELVVKFFHGEFTSKGFVRYSGMWKGPPPGTIGKKDISVGMEGLKAQMKNPMFVSKGGIGYGVDESQKVLDDNKGWVWLAAEMSPGGLALELLKSVPYQACHPCGEAEQCGRDVREGQLGSGNRQHREDLGRPGCQAAVMRDPVFHHGSGKCKHQYASLL